MPDTDAAAPKLDNFKSAATRSQEAGADETAAFDGSAAKGALPSIDEGDPATKNGSGNSETD